MARFAPVYAGRWPAETIEEKLIPADCRCTWSYNGRMLGEGGLYTLKFLNALCAEHREVKRADPALVP